MQAKGGDDDDKVEEGDNDSVVSDVTTVTTKSAQSTGKKRWSGYQRHTAVSAGVGATAAVHKQTMHTGALCELSNQILLDTGSSIGGTFMNPDMVVGIKVAKQPI